MMAGRTRCASRRRTEAAAQGANGRLARVAAWLARAAAWLESSAARRFAICALASATASSGVITAVMELEAAAAGAADTEGDRDGDKCIAPSERGVAKRMAATGETQRPGR